MENKGKEMELHILYVQGKGYYWELKGDKAFTFEGYEYFNTAQGALSDWRRVQDRLNIAIRYEIVFEEGTGL